MKKIIKFKKISNNEFVLFNDKGEYKTLNGNRILVDDGVKAKLVIKNIKKEKNFRKSNFIKLLFYSNDLNEEKKNIIKKEILNYIDTDLICYRAEKESDLELIQRRKWNPYLHFCKNKFDLNFDIKYSIMPSKQKVSNLAKIMNIINKMNNYYMTAFYFLVNLTNSPIISLNILFNKIPIETVWEDSQLEDYYNQSKWGEDQEQTQKLLLKKNFLTDIINFIEIFNLKEEYEREN